MLSKNVIDLTKESHSEINDINIDIPVVNPNIIAYNKALDAVINAFHYASLVGDLETTFNATSFTFNMVKMNKSTECITELKKISKLFNEYSDLTDKINMATTATAFNTASNIFNDVADVFTKECNENNGIKIFPMTKCLNAASYGLFAVASMYPTVTPLHMTFLYASSALNNVSNIYTNLNATITSLKTAANSFRDIIINTYKMNPKNIDGLYFIPNDDFNIHKPELVHIDKNKLMNIVKTLIDTTNAFINAANAFTNVFNNNDKIRIY